MSKTENNDSGINAYTVCGLVVLTRPENYSNVLDRLSGIEGVDVHNSADTGRFAITLEEFPDSPLMTHQIEQVRSLPGVVDVSLAYTHTEPLINDEGQGIPAGTSP
ncbi:chaperone NapD [Endozoicomonas arenosclerae]|uniref:chaperone NapD n=1 Tax=Endozoicomonas arenosclerae TaxID=1633495 RepID=UPI00078505E8|nr:chaperone NapD [Endozoicomonas arenosclerae]